MRVGAAAGRTAAEGAAEEELLEARGTAPAIVFEVWMLTTPGETRSARSAKLAGTPCGTIGSAPGAFVPEGLGRCGLLAPRSSSLPKRSMACATLPRQLTRIVERARRRPGRRRPPWPREACCRMRRVDLPSCNVSRSCERRTGEASRLLGCPRFRTPRGRPAFPSLAGASRDGARSDQRNRHMVPAVSALNHDQGSRAAPQAPGRRGAAPRRPPGRGR